MIALIAVALLSAAQAEPAPAPPPADAKVAESKPFTRPRPRIIGAAEGPLATNFIAAITPLLRERPAVRRAALVMVDYGPDGHRRALVIEAADDPELRRLIVAEFTRLAPVGESLVVAFLPKSELDYVSATAAPFYTRP